MMEFIALSKQAKNLTRQRFARLVALGPIGVNSAKRVLWKCRCDCGKFVNVRSDLLHSGQVKSCGCFNSEVHSSLLKTHGLSQTKFYAAWRGMVQRCTVPKFPSYKEYGGRGIRVCDEWMDNVEAFHDYVSQLPHFGEKGYTLDRIDNHGNYEPGNVRWASKSVQSRNSRQVRLFTYGGKTQCLRDWADELGYTFDTLRGRILKLGWPIERAFTEPSHK